MVGVAVSTLVVVVVGSKSSCSRITCGRSRSMSSRSSSSSSSSSISSSRRSSSTRNTKSSSRSSSSGRRRRRSRISFPDIVPGWAGGDTRRVRHPSPDVDVSSTSGGPGGERGYPYNVHTICVAPTHGPIQRPGASAPASAANVAGGDGNGIGHPARGPGVAGASWAAGGAAAWCGATCGPLGGPQS